MPTSGPQWCGHTRSPIASEKRSSGPALASDDSVSVGNGAVIHAFSYIEKSTIGARALVGPFARLRPGTSLGDGAKISSPV